MTTVNKAIVSIQRGVGIHAYTTPNSGKDHKRILGHIFKNGETVSFDLVKTNKFGGKWYRHGQNQWLCGRFLKPLKSKEQENES